MKSVRTRRRKILKIIFIAGTICAVAIALFYINLYRTYAGVCFTPEQVQADQRCLFIYSNRVFEKGTRAAPHQGNQCGTDVTAIIPSFHYMSVAQYLDPNYVGDICTVTPTPTDTPAPTATVAPTNGPSCPLKSKGDANCDGKITLTDFAIWRNEFLGTDPKLDADFNGDGAPTILDFAIWRNSFLSQ